MKLNVTRFDIFSLAREVAELLEMKATSMKSRSLLLTLKNRFLWKVTRIKSGR